MARSYQIILNEVQAHQLFNLTQLVSHAGLMNAIREAREGLTDEEFNNWYGIKAGDATRMCEVAGDLFEALKPHFDPDPNKNWVLDVSEKGT